MNLNTYTQQTEALKALTAALILQIEKQDRYEFNIALPGGTSAHIVFDYWRTHCAQSIPWHRIRFYWVDERCVPPTSDDSNFKLAYRLLFEPLSIPASHYFRIQGEHKAAEAARLYSMLIYRQLPRYHDVPQFDAILLGIGLDLHIASLFPPFLSECKHTPQAITAVPSLLSAIRPYAVSTHPVTRQARVTMTAPFILNNSPLFIPLLGEVKAKLVPRLADANTPAGYILQKAKRASIFVGTT